MDDMQVMCSIFFGCNMCNDWRKRALVIFHRAYSSYTITSVPHSDWDDHCHIGNSDISKGSLAEIGIVVLPCAHTIPTATMCRLTGVSGHHAI